MSFQAAVGEIALSLSERPRIRRQRRIREQAGIA
jgi:hypothetical protein